MSDDQLTAIPKGSWILVTGIGGFLATHVSKQLLDRGYKVRGTVRDPSANKWVTEEMFANANQRGDIELAALDFTTASESDYDTAVQGVHGVLHVAAIQTFDPDPNNVIPHVVASVTKLLGAAKRVPTVKRFIYTSSSVAAFMPNPFADEETFVGRDSWNEMAQAAAYAPPPHSPAQGAIVYMASKASAEQALWKFSADEKPNFDVSVVSPYTLIGPILHKSFVDKNLPSWLNQLYHGQVDYIKNFPALYYVNVKDVSLLHVAALLDPDVKDARIQAWCTPFNWNTFLAMWRKKYPQRQFVDDLPNMGMIRTRIDDTLPKQLLKKWGGQNGWIPMEVGVQECIDSVLSELDT